MMKKVVVNKTQKGGNKRTKSMMDSKRAESLGLKNGGPTGKYPSKGMNKLASKNPKVAKKIMGYKKGGKA